MRIFGRRQRIRSSSGFTLIETLVAISVLLLSLTGPLSLAAQAIQSAYYARDQITAFYLAQEAVEYVRAKRDQNYLNAASWLNTVDDCVNAVCNVDFPAFLHSVCASQCPALLYNSTSGLYGTQSGDSSPFRRELSIIPVSANEVSVRARVYWQSGPIPRTFEIRENLFNWSPLAP